MALKKWQLSVLGMKPNNNRDVLFPLDSKMFIMVTKGFDPEMLGGKVFRIGQREQPLSGHLAFWSYSFTSCVLLSKSFNHSELLSPPW